MTATLVRDTFDKQIVFVSGITRSGKSLVCSVVSSFDKVDLTHVDFQLEQIPRLYGMGLITKNVASYLLRTGLNQAIYDGYLGRNLNFRQSDLMTSIFSFSDPGSYIERLANKEGTEAVTRINDSLSAFLMMIHYGIEYLDLWIDFFPSAKMVNVQRDPVDICWSWVNKGYGKDFFDSVRSTTPAIDARGTAVPYTALGWETEYVSMNFHERIVNTVLMASKNEQASIDNMRSEHVDRVLNVKFEVFASQSDLSLADISTFLEKNPSSYSPSVMVRERIPRCMAKMAAEREKKLRFFEAELKRDTFDRLVRESELYQATIIWE